MHEFVRTGLQQVVLVPTQLAPLLWCIVSVQALDEVLPPHAIVPHYAVVDAGEADTPPHNPDL